MGVGLSKSDLNGYATEDYVKNQISTIDLTGYTKSDTLSEYVKTEQLAGYAKSDTLSEYVKTEQLAGYAKSDTLSEYVKTEQLAGYAKSEELATYINTEVKNDVVIKKPLIQYNDGRLHMNTPGGDLYLAGKDGVIVGTGLQGEGKSGSGSFSVEGITTLHGGATIHNGLHVPGDIRTSRLCYGPDGSVVCIGVDQIQLKQ